MRHRHRPPDDRVITTRRCILALLAPLALPVYGAVALSCPDGGHPQGNAPPAGYEWKCVDANGAVDGPWRTWYTNGQLMSERHMKHGREHGRQRSWWPNGQLMMEGVSVDGHRYQGFKYWTIDGEPTQLNIERETVIQPVSP
jgi:hypothetical protein